MESLGWRAHQCFASSVYPPAFHLQDDVVELGDAGVTVDTEGCFRHVLLVSDDTEYLLLLQLAFAAQGWLTTTATSGTEAVQSCNRFQAIAAVDVIITDHEMSGITGLGMLKELRERCCAAPALVMTDSFDAEDLQTEAAFVEAMLIEKPLVISELRELAIAATATEKWADEIPSCP